MSRLAFRRLWQPLWASKYKNKSRLFMFLAARGLPHSLHVCYSADNKLPSRRTILYVHLIPFDAVKGEIKDDLLRGQ
jgi:hypothetical protein